MSGKRYQHLAETDHACKERIALIIRQMKGREGVTEALKIYYLLFSVVSIILFLAIFLKQKT